MKDGNANSDLENEVFDAFNNMYPSDSIDSRTFTYVPKKEVAHRSIPKDNKPSPWRVFLAFMVSTAAFCAGSQLYLFTFDIRYRSTLQTAACIVPLLMMVIFFHLINREISKVQIVFLLIWYCILFYFLFQITMCRSIMDLYQGITFPQAWEYLKIIKRKAETKSIYYGHFLPTYLTNVIMCIILAWVWDKP